MSFIRVISWLFDVVVHLSGYGYWWLDKSSGPVCGGISAFGRTDIHLFISQRLLRYGSWRDTYRLKTHQKSKWAALEKHAAQINRVKQFICFPNHSGQRNHRLRHSATVASPDNQAQAPRRCGNVENLDPQLHAPAAGGQRRDHPATAVPPAWHTVSRAATETDNPSATAW